MDCREAVYSNDYFDFIAEFGQVPGLTIEETECIQELNERFKIVHKRRGENETLNLTKYSYLSIPNCLGPLDTSHLEASGILRIQNQPNLALKGNGVLIGFMDSGIDYQNPLFRNSDGSSRIEAIWDQTVENGTPPEGFIYGQEYRKPILDEALAARAPLEIVPTTDNSGHGTYIASIAAGNEDIANSFSGAAPLCGIAMVKLKQAKQYIRDFFFIREDAQAYQINDVMTAIEYLNRLASELNMPLVLCLGLGSSYGSHTGVGPVALLLEQIATQAQRAVVIAAGNEANRRLHYAGVNYTTGTDELVEVNVGENVTGFTAELWGETPDLYSVEIISPTGERLPRIPARAGAGIEHNFVFENTRVTVEYRISDITSGEQQIFIRFQNPIQGIWNIRVFGDSIVRGRYHIWLTFSGFLTGDVFFIRSNPDTTLTVPSSTDIPITVGAYNSADNSIYLYSGRGFMPNDVIKPDFAAPGVDIPGAGPNNTFVTNSGTSAAAAITAGAAALLLEWAVVKGNNMSINSVTIKYILIRGTVRDANRVYPNREWGYGKLNLFNAFNAFRIT